MENIIIYCPYCGTKHIIKFLDNERFDVEFKCSCGEVIKVESEDKKMTYGYCVYHELDCDYKGRCIDCPHNTVEDIEWFRQDEERAESDKESEE